MDSSILPQEGTAHEPLGGLDLRVAPWSLSMGP